MVSTRHDDPITALGHEALGHESGRESTKPVDFTFLAKQTFGDDDLERDLLTLFADQARRILPGLPELPPHRQAETAHLLKGSARGIGAWPAAAAADAFEAAAPMERRLAYDRMAAAFADVLSAIATRLAESRPPDAES